MLIKLFASSLHTPENWIGGGKLEKTMSEFVCKQSNQETIWILFNWPVLDSFRLLTVMKATILAIWLTNMLHIRRRQDNRDQD